MVTLKAHSLPAIAGQIRALLAPGAAAVFFTNGVPWWWNHGIDEEEGSLPLLDPDGLLWRDLGPDSVLGGVVYSANAVTEPGVITPPPATAGSSASRPAMPRRGRMRRRRCSSAPGSAAR